MKTNPLFYFLGVIFLYAGSINYVISQETKKCEKASEITVKNLDSCQALVIKADIPTSQVGPKMGEIYGKIFAYAGEQQIELAGPPFAVYWKFDPQGNTVFEAGIPVGKGVTGNEEIEYKEYPSVKVVSMLYTGAYEKMEPAYLKMMDYIKNNNLKDKGVSWEVYLTDPAEEPDPEKYQTVINLFVE